MKENKENFVSLRMRTATGRLEVGNGALGVNTAGVNGSGSSSSDIRFWGGATYANRATAPFRVQQDGTVYGSKGIFGGWKLASDAIYACDDEYKHTNDGYSAEGITLAANGSIHAKRFYINQDGSIGIRSSANGKRIEIDSTNNRMDFYNTGGNLEIRLDENMYGAYAGLKVLNPTTQTTNCVHHYLGIAAYWEGTERVSIYATSTGCIAKLSGLPTGGSNLKALSVDTTTGLIYRAT